MSRQLLGLPGWWALAAVLVVGARLGVAPRALSGAAIGLALGSTYVWMLVRRTRTTVGLSPGRAAAAAQAGGAARMVFVLLGFGLAFRAAPGAGMAWGAGAFFVPVVVRMVGLVRGVRG